MAEQGEQDPWSLSGRDAVQLVSLFEQAIGALMTLPPNAQGAPTWIAAAELWGEVEKAAVAALNIPEPFRSASASKRLRKLKPPVGRGIPTSLLGAADHAWSRFARGKSADDDRLDDWRRFATVEELGIRIDGQGVARGNEERCRQLLTSLVGGGSSDTDEELGSELEDGFVRAADFDVSALPGLVRSLGEYWHQIQTDKSTRQQAHLLGATTIVPAQIHFVQAAAHRFGWWDLLSDLSEAVGEQIAPPGWHEDPTGRYSQRHWDGHRWTGMVLDEDGNLFEDETPV